MSEIEFENGSNIKSKGNTECQRGNFKGAEVLIMPQEFTSIIQIKNLRDSKPINPWDIRVDRVSILGNPFKMKNESERDDVCDSYKQYLYKRLNLVLSLIKSVGDNIDEGSVLVNVPEASKVIEEMDYIELEKYITETREDVYFDHLMDFEEDCKESED